MGIELSNKSTWLACVRVTHLILQPTGHLLVGTSASRFWSGHTPLTKPSRPSTRHIPTCLPSQTLHILHQGLVRWVHPLHTLPKPQIYPQTPGLDQDTHPGYQPRPLCPPNFIPPKPYPIFRINPTCISCILFQLALSISNTDKRSPHNRSLSKNTNNIKDQNSILLSHLNPPVL